MTNPNLSERQFWLRHVTPAENKDSILEHGIQRGRGRNFNTNPRHLFFTTSDEHAHRWAKEIANQRGEAGTYSVFAVDPTGGPVGSWRGVAKTKHGEQAVVQDHDIPREKVKWLHDVDVHPRRGKRTFS